MRVHASLDTAADIDHGSYQSNEDVNSFHLSQTNLSIISTPTDQPGFRPGYRFYLAFASLTILAMMVSLDGTSVSVALPVSDFQQDVKNRLFAITWTHLSVFLDG